MATIERSQQLDFDEPVDVVLRMLTDLDFYRTKYEALGFHELRVTEENAGDADFAVLASYRTQTDLPLPGWARKALPENIHVEHSDQWKKDGDTGRITIRIHGAPVRVEARMGLKDRGGAASNHVDWRFSCSVPLIGGRLAELVADDVCSKAERDHEYGRKRAAEYRT